MRIATVVHSGVKHDARVLKGATTLKAQGHDVRLFGLTPGESEEFLLPNGVPVYLEHRDLTDLKSRVAREGLPKGRESAIWTSFHIQGELIFENVLRTFKPDIVHIHDHVALSAAGKYKASFECPIIWDAHEIYEDLAHADPERSAVNARIIGTNAPNVDGFVTLNASMAQFYREKYPDLPFAKLVPNATIRTSRPKYDNRLHEAAGLAPDQNIALFQGVFAQHRGINAILDSTRLLDTNWTVVFMGWGHHENEIKSYAEDKTDRPTGRPRVSVVPGVPHSDLLKWTAGASIGLIPYEDSGLNHRFCSPNKLWEYPAAGVPILATDLPELEKHLREHGIGVTVPRTLEPESIATTINRLGEKDLVTLKNNCAIHARSEHWEKYEPTLTALYAALAHPAGVAPPVTDTVQTPTLRSRLVKLLKIRKPSR